MMHEDRDANVALLRQLHSADALIEKLMGALEKRRIAAENELAWWGQAADVGRVVIELQELVTFLRADAMTE